MDIESVDRAGELDSYWRAEANLAADFGANILGYERGRLTKCCFSHTSGDDKKKLCRKFAGRFSSRCIFHPLYIDRRFWVVSIGSGKSLAHQAF